MLQTIIIHIAFVGVSFATVLPIGNCPQPTSTYTASAAPFYYGPPVLDTDVASCNSTDTTTCALGVSASTSAGYTITMGAGLTLDLPEIGSIAFNPSVSYSYTTTKGTSDGVNCPEGGYTCGMTSVTPWQIITGNQHSCGGGAWPACKPCGDNSYAIQVPAQTAEISWAACIASDSLNQNTGPNLEKCP
ncbi:MAG: hypothetical protein Q9161_005825 [Pseudevernia consocians]